MHLDLRYPIGLLLTLYGVILVLQGATVRAMVLGLNVNLYWGAVMIASGLGTIYLARRQRKSQGTNHKLQSQKSMITNHRDTETQRQ